MTAYVPVCVRMRVRARPLQATVITMTVTDELRQKIEESIDVSVLETE